MTTDLQTMTATVTLPEPISKVLAECQIAPDRAALVAESFAPFFASAHDQLAACREITVTDAKQVTAMKAARAGRLALKEIRVEAEKKRKGLKDESLRIGRAIDGMANILKLMIEPEEERLEKCERFAELQEEAERQQRVIARSDRLRPYGVNPADYSLGTMKDEAFDELVRMLAKQREEAIAAEAEANRRAEEERIAREAEAKRIREENERLKAEAAAAKRVAEEAARAAEAERRAAQEKLESERREAQAKIDAERRAREEVERKQREAEAAIAKLREAEIKAAEADKRRAARAPDRKKVARVAESVRSVEIPEVSSDEGRAAMDQVRTILADAALVIDRISLGMD